MNSLQPKEVHEMQENDDAFVLLDIREPHEHNYCRLPDSKHIPMQEVPDRLNELNKDDKIVVYCRTGVRSARVCQFLSTSGFENVFNLAGGVYAWHDQVDSSIPKY